MLTHYDEAERAAWWEEMEQIRNNKAAEVQGRSLGDDSNEEEKELAGYMWANFLCAEEVMAQEGVPVQRYLAAYGNLEKGETTKEGEDESDENEGEACGDWRYDDEQQGWMWQAKCEDNWQQPSWDDVDRVEQQYEEQQGGEQGYWLVKDPEEQTNEHEEEEAIGVEMSKEEEKVEEEPWRESAERGGAEGDDAEAEAWGAGGGEEEAYDQAPDDEWSEWNEYDDQQ